MKIKTLLNKFDSIGYLAEKLKDSDILQSKDYIELLNKLT